MTQLRDVADSAGEVAVNLESAVHSSLKDQPMATLAVVAALGFVVGAIWKT